MDVGQPNLDQLRIFLAIVDEGSFNRAAGRLGRAISVVSYGMTQLEAQLGVRLFEREGSRRPVLTAAGQALVANARAVIDEIDGIVAKVRGLRRGLEAELALAVDVMVEPRIVALVLRDFQQAFPTVDLRLHVEALGAVAALLLESRADLALAGPDIVDHPELERSVVGSVEMVPVAAPAHPLARLSTIPPGTARKHIQLVLSDRSPLTEGRDFAVHSSRTWRLADLGAKHALLLEGIGWGNMPRHAIAADLAAGRLVALSVPEAPALGYRLHTLWRKDSPPGPAGQWMRDRLTQELAKCEWLETTR